jgi:hypothetical protein
MMDLKDFIKTTLTEIVEGVHEAREIVKNHEAANQGAEVAPFVFGHTSATYIKLPSSHPGGEGPAVIVEFDVAVTVVETSEKKLQGGAKLAILSVGAGGNQSSQNTAVSRIKFNVPLALPRGKKVVETAPQVQSTSRRSGRSFMAS